VSSKTLVDLTIASQVKEGIEKLKGWASTADGQVKLAQVVQGLQETKLTPIGKVGCSLWPSLVPLCDACR
jgi:hypothetical protein